MARKTLLKTEPRCLWNTGAMAEPFFRVFFFIVMAACTRLTGNYHYCLPSTGHGNNMAQSKVDKFLSLTSHLSPFFTVYLLFKCRFVARGGPREVAILFYVICTA